MYVKEGKKYRRCGYTGFDIKIDKISIGDTDCYCHEKGFYRVAEIGEKAAREILAFNNLSFSKEFGVLECYENSSTYRDYWLNKQYIIIGNNFSKITAVYNHDGRYYIVIKEVKND